jgi:hypothetical protein
VIDSAATPHERHPQHGPVADRGSRFAFPIAMPDTHHHRELATQEPIARAARVGCAIAGGWLFLSAFLWADPAERRVSDAVVGALALVIALAALYVRPRLHVGNVLLSIWLFASFAILPTTSIATQFSDLLVATLLFGFSVVPPGLERPDEGSLRHA